MECSMLTSQKCETLCPSHTDPKRINFTLYSLYLRVSYYISKGIGCRNCTVIFIESYNCIRVEIITKIKIGYDVNYENTFTIYTTFGDSPGMNRNIFS